MRFELDPPAVATAGFQASRPMLIGCVPVGEGVALL